MKDKQSWTWKQFHKAMKDAGWRLNTKEGVFRHKDTGAIFNPFNWSSKRKGKYGNGEMWYLFAIRHETPTEAPF